MTKAKNPIISNTSDWSFELLTEYNNALAKVAEKYNLDIYPNQLEIITAEQMMDAYSSVGMPLGYNHWSFGKQFLTVEQHYKHGYMGLAYELVINSNPCIAYLMEENSMVMQALVIAHACYGHNSFFKGNYLFKTWTSADSIIDYLVFAKNYVAECEEKYGVENVEYLLDACHALMNYGVDRYKRPAKLSITKEKLRQSKRAEYLQSQVNEIWRTLPKKLAKKYGNKQDRFPKDPEENILYFLEKNAPLLEPWEREIIRIVRKMAQYFYPQRQTKVMNEGWATFWHYTLINEIYNQGLVNDQFMLEFLHTHTNVIYQYPFDHPNYTGINPYTLGFNIFTDIRRICENPTDEDRRWFPDIVDTNWVETVDFAMRNFKDESFISQYLSPKLIRDLKLFALLDDENNTELEVKHIHDEQGYQKIRELLAQQYNLANIDPNIQVYNVDIRGDRSLTLRYIQPDHRPLDQRDTNQVLKHLYKIWKFTTKLEVVTSSGEVTPYYECPELPNQESDAAPSNSGVVPVYSKPPGNGSAHGTNSSDSDII